MSTLYVLDCILRVLLIVVIVGFMTGAVKWTSTSESEP